MRIRICPVCRKNVHWWQRKTWGYWHVSHYHRKCWQLEIDLYEKELQQ